MIETPECPVCARTRILDTVRRDRLPTMQNYVHRTRASALASPEGQLVLSVCGDCGFAWNRSFDPGLLVYDENYDNCVPSSVMQRYYAEIASHLVQMHDLREGLVVDIGCGDGSFLRAICEAAPGMRGLGIDPALADSRCEDDGRIVFIKDVFAPDLVSERPAITVLRHVLEHIPEPASFLRSIADAVGRFGPCPVFVEVPDLEWIVSRQAFWDFCYEHCNYFIPASLTEALARAGLEVATTRGAFGGQYLWAEARTGQGGGRLSSSAGETTGRRLAAYAADEATRIELSRELLRQAHADRSASVVWGMATKGVLFAILTDPDATAIDKCIDVNVNKQGAYVPLTGHLVEGPTALTELVGPLSVLVMNENYRAEIEQACADLGVTATFHSP